VDLIQSTYSGMSSKIPGLVGWEQAPPDDAIPKSKVYTPV
jgi:hypothetical protein